MVKLIEMINLVDSVSLEDIRNLSKVVFNFENFIISSNEFGGKKD